MGRISWATLYAAVALACAVPAAATTYVAEDVPRSQHINDLGQVGLLDINNSGHLAGYNAVGSLGGSNDYNGINELDQTVGTSFVPGIGRAHAALWTGGAITDLGALAADGGSFASAINDAGVIVGGADATAPGVFVWAVYWSGGVIHKLDDLGSNISYANDVNNAGVIVGESTYAPFSFRAVAWTGGVLQDLGTLGGDFSAAFAVNELGQIVGNASPVAGPSHGFIWEGGSMQDLSTLTLNLSDGEYIGEAWDINESGQILATIRGPDNAFRTVILTPVPEPGGWALLILGFGGAGAGLRIARRSAKTPLASAVG